MESHSTRACGCGAFTTDHGPEPFAAHITGAAQQNKNFRAAFWTGEHLQMTLMSIPAGEEIGLELHSDTEQFIRVESGRALVCIGTCKEKLEFQHCLGAGDGVFVPAGTWHNIRNLGDCPLKLSSIYAPPRHPKGTIHRTKAEASHKH